MIKGGRKFSPKTYAYKTNRQQHCLLTEVRLLVLLIEFPINKLARRDVDCINLNMLKSGSILLRYSAK